MGYDKSTQSYGFNFSYLLTPWVKRLLIANTVVFFLTWIIGPDLVHHWFAFEPRSLLFRPWGLVTYMFLHGDVWHLLINMLVLFFFGPPLEARWGSREFMRFYLVCGLGGALLSFLFAPQGIIGASAAVYGVMLAFAITWPEAPIYVWGIFPIKAKWLASFLFAITFLSAVGGADGGIAHFAHLGGLVTGLLYLKVDWRGSGKPEKRKKSSGPRRLAIVPRDQAHEAEEGEQRARAQRKEDEALLDRVDAILDKISAKGMSSLSPDEVRILDQVSKRHRTN
jgi:membrane associated rhomboid family serine protease